MGDHTSTETDSEFAGWDAAMAEARQTTEEVQDRMSNWYGPILMYAHEETDEEPEYGTNLKKLPAGLHSDFGVRLARTNPLYEVSFQFYVNPVSERYYVTGVSLDDSNWLERPIPVHDNSGDELADLEGYEYEIPED